MEHARKTATNRAEGSRAVRRAQERRGSKEKAARISNAAAKEGRSAVGRRGGEHGDYEDWTVPQLRARAKELGLTGYSGKRMSELISALRNH